MVFSHLQMQLTSGIESLTQSSLGNTQVIPQLEYLKELPGSQLNEAKGYRKLEVAECCLTHTPSHTCAQRTMVSNILIPDFACFIFDFLLFGFVLLKQRLASQ